jgi:signal peptidase II
LISLGTLVADQLAKCWVVRAFHLGESLPLLPPVLSFTYVQNTGAAFGLFKGQQVVFIAVSLAVIVWMLKELRAAATLPASHLWAYALVLGGAVGNLIDRLRVGYVIDFIDLHVWPVFNIGDSAITIGVCLLLWHHLRGSCTPSS